MPGRQRIARESSVLGVVVGEPCFNYVGLVGIEDRDYALYIVLVKNRISKLVLIFYRQVVISIVNLSIRLVVTSLIISKSPSYV